VFMISPNNILGFLIFAFLLCFVAALLIYATVNLLLPNSSDIALVAALLFIVSPIEPARFYVIWQEQYVSSQFALVLMIWLFARSYLHCSRWMLLAASMVFVVSSLTSEAIVPAALAIAFLPLIIWHERRDRYTAALWAYTWFGAAAIIIARFIYFYTFPHRVSYQSNIASGAPGPSVLFNHLIMHFTATLDYVRPHPNWLAYLPQGLFVAGLALAVLIVPLPRATQHPGPKSLLVALAGGAVAILLTVCPFVLFDKVWRTEFLALPFQAVAWAVTIALFGLLLPPRWYRGGQLVMSALVIVVSICSVLATNENAVYGKMKLYPAISYDKTRRILEQVHRIAPGFQADTAVVFYLDAPGPSIEPDTPFGVNYFLSGLGETVLGVKNTFQTNYTDNLRWTTTFTRQGLQISDTKKTFPYDTLVVFRLSSNGTVSLVDELPSEWLPPGTDTSGYDPAKQIVRDKQRPLRVF